MYNNNLYWLYYLICIYLWELVSTILSDINILLYLKNLLVNILLELLDALLKNFQHFWNLFSSWTNSNSVKEVKIGSLFID